jgi:phospholipase/carboxylesterase
MSCEWLRARGFPVQWRTWPMPHSVCAEEIAALRDWIGERLRSDD